MFEMAELDPYDKSFPSFLPSFSLPPVVRQRFWNFVYFFSADSFSPPTTLFSIEGRLNFHSLFLNFILFLKQDIHISNCRLYLFHFLKKLTFSLPEILSGFVHMTIGHFSDASQHSGGSNMVKSPPPPPGHVAFLTSVLQQALS